MQPNYIITGQKNRKNGTCLKTVIKVKSDIGDWYGRTIHYSCFWPIALKLGCITNNYWDIFFFMMEFICLVDEIKLMPFQYNF